MTRSKSSARIISPHLFLNNMWHIAGTNALANANLFYQWQNWRTRPKIAQMSILTNLMMNTTTGHLQFYITCLISLLALWVLVLSSCIAFLCIRIIIDYHVFIYNHYVFGGFVLRTVIVIFHRCVKVKWAIFFRNLHCYEKQPYSKND